MGMLSKAFKGGNSSADGPFEWSVWGPCWRLWCAHSDCEQQCCDAAAKPPAEAQEEQQAHLSQMHSLRGGALLHGSIQMQAWAKYWTKSLLTCLRLL